MNANDIIKGALRKLVVIPAGVSPSTSQNTEGLEVLNDLVSSWSADASMVYQDTLEEITLTAGTQSFTLGPTGDYVTNKPTTVKHPASIRKGLYEYPLEEADKNSYAEFRDKTRRNLPHWLYFRNTHPDSTFYFDVTTDQEYTFILTSMKELTQFPDGTTEIVLPDYYKKAFVDNLTLELGPGSGAAKRITPLMIAQAEDSKSRVIGKAVKIAPSKTELANNNRFNDADYGNRYN